MRCACVCLSSYAHAAHALFSMSFKSGSGTGCTPYRCTPCTATTKRLVGCQAALYYCLFTWVDGYVVHRPRPTRTVMQSGKSTRRAKTTRSGPKCGGVLAGARRARAQASSHSSHSSLAALASKRGERDLESNNVEKRGREPSQHGDQVEDGLSVKVATSIQQNKISAILKPEEIAEILYKICRRGRLFTPEMFLITPLHLDHTVKNLFTL